MSKSGETRDPDRNLASAKSILRSFPDVESQSPFFINNIDLVIHRVNDELLGKGS